MDSTSIQAQTHAGMLAGIVMRAQVKLSVVEALLEKTTKEPLLKAQLIKLCNDTNELQGLASELKAHKKEGQLNESLAKKLDDLNFFERVYQSGQNAYQVRELLLDSPKAMQTYIDTYKSVDPRMLAADSRKRAIARLKTLNYFFHECFPEEQAVQPRKAKRALTLLDEQEETKQAATRRAFLAELIALQNSYTIN